MTIKFKKLHKDAKAPTQGKEGDACWDITCVDVTVGEEERYLVYKTGLAIEIPEDHVGLIFPRSSLSNHDMWMANHVSVIDPGYRGEVTIRMKLAGTIEGPKIYQTGDRIVQMMIIPRPFLEWKEVEELSTTQRGTGGYGSTGN